LKSGSTVSTGCW